MGQTRTQMHIHNNKKLKKSQITFLLHVQCYLYIRFWSYVWCACVCVGATPLLIWRDFGSCPRFVHISCPLPEMGNAENLENIPYFQWRRSLCTGHAIFSTYTHGQKKLTSNIKMCNNCKKKMMSNSYLSHHVLYLTSVFSVHMCMC